MAQSLHGRSHPRRQAERLAGLLAREETGFRGVVLGKRREGKTDLLRQVHALLFQKAEGPLPFRYSFERGREEAARARRFVAAFCQQARAFLMRQEDLLGEPLAHLEKELERPGLPLSLTELGRDFLALSAAEQTDFAAALPGQFAHREGRPVCLLLDDAEALGAGPPEPRLRRAGSPFLAVLEAPHLCWLLTGRRPFLARVAGQEGWLLAPLEPFSREEVLSLAEKKCGEVGLRFSRGVWEKWFEMAGASPAWIQGLIDAAILSEQSMESIEGLGRVYLKELAAGTLGNWLAGRWEQAIPDRRDRAAIAGQLVSLANKELSPSAASFPPAVWDGLVEEEWAEETALAPVVRLGVLERDWLSLVTSPAGAASLRTLAKALQAFLLRAEQARQFLEQKAFAERVPPFSVRGAERDESRIRLSELEARAQWLEEELAAAREQFQNEMSQGTAAAGAPGDRPVSSPGGSLTDPQERYWRMAISLSLLLVSTDLLAINLQSNPAMLNAVRDIQSQSQRLLEVLRAYDRRASSEDASRKTEGPSECV